MPKTPALSLRCYRPQQRWQLDSLEYADKLSPAEREWLGRFLQAHYHGRRSGIQPLDLQRKSDVSRKHNDSDLYSRASVPGVNECVEHLAGDVNGGVGDSHLRHSRNGSRMEFRALAEAGTLHPEEERVEALESEAARVLRIRLRLVRAETRRGHLFRARFRRARLEAAQVGGDRHRQA